MLKQFTQGVRGLLRSADPFDITPLAGDASNRSYHRVTQGNTSYILMRLSDPEGFKKSEEAVTGDVPVNELPFLNMQRYLARAGWPVPEVIASSLDEGLILLEDLGDVSLMAAIDGAAEEEVMARYWEAVDLLVSMQQDTLTDKDCVAFHRTYTEELLAWEFEHFVEYGIEARLGAIPAATRKALSGHFNNIAKQIAAQPTVLVHRDYHSRNIMVRQSGPEAGHLAVIDFQDALMGPATYDLASLIWDPYVTLPEGVAEDITARYWAQAPVKLGVDFPRVLNLTALQRLLKAAGRFVYIDKVKGNPAFLADVPTCLARARWLLGGMDELAPLLDILAELDEAFAS
ncbi:MAG: aminoglycoside phosphotransferase family protein [Leptospirillia bacterium]